MRHLARRHPLIVGLGLALLSPYILAAIAVVMALWVFAYVAAIALDAVAGRR